MQYCTVKATDFFFFFFKAHYNLIYTVCVKVFFYFIFKAHCNLIYAMCQTCLDRTGLDDLCLYGLCRVPLHHLNCLTSILLADTSCSQSGTSAVTQRSHNESCLPKDLLVCSQENRKLGLWGGSKWVHKSYGNNLWWSRSFYFSQDFCSCD